jgi:hypothetical protein
MGETRKSDFTGDRYGEWVVTGRAPALNKKRAWHVMHEPTDERKVVLQTALGDLGAIGTPVESPWEPTDAQAATAAAIGGIVAPPSFEKMVHDAYTTVTDNPFDLLFVGSFYVDDPDDLPLDLHDGDVINERPKAGPGDCQHGVQILDCATCEPLLGHQGREALAKYPQKYDPTLSPAGTIAASVLEANALHAMISESDWAADLEPGEATVPPQDDDEPVVRLGEFADENVTEADLDAAVPPQDELRAAVRNVMGKLFDYKQQMESVHAQLTVAHESLAELMDAVDVVMKHAVTR